MSSSDTQKAASSVRSPINRAFQQAGEHCFWTRWRIRPIQMQVKLLRAIQEKKVRLVGLQKEEPCGCASSAHA